jgi:hypothetical protein
MAIRDSALRAENALKAGLGVKKRANPDSHFEARWTEFFLKSLLRWIATAMTAGIGYWYFKVYFIKWQYGKTVIGGKRLSYTGTAMSFFVQTIIWYILIVITFSIYLIWLPVKKRQYFTKNTHFVHEDGSSRFDGRVLDYFLIRVGTFVLSMLTFGAAGAWSKSIKQSFIYENTVYDGKQLAFTAAGNAFFAMKIVWRTFSIVTFGFYSLLAKPCAYTRFTAENLAIVE